jgi:hypothetical protein
MSFVFEEIENNNVIEEDGKFVGGVSIHFNKESVDEPKKRFENLVVPIGLHIGTYNSGGGDYDIHDHSFMDETRFSKLFYSVAKDLGGSVRKSRTTTITKKNRR